MTSGCIQALKILGDQVRKEYDFSNGKRGAVIDSAGKTYVSVMIDDDVLDAFRRKAEALGSGYQSMMNAALRAAIAAEGSPHANG